jgi:hypothetical protein
MSDAGAGMSRSYAFTIFHKLLRRWRGDRERCGLIVEGVIIELGRHTPRTHLGPVGAAEEAYVSLQIGQARLANGRAQEPSSVIPPEFSGDVALVEQFKVGDSVRITTTTSTGRLIESMETVDSIESMD